MNEQNRPQISFLDHLMQSTEAQKVELEKKEREERLFKAYETGELNSTKVVDQVKARDAAISDMKQNENKSAPIARVKNVNKPRTEPKPRVQTASEDKKSAKKEIVPKRDGDSNSLGVPIYEPSNEEILAERNPDDLIDDEVEILHNETLTKILGENSVILPKWEPELVHPGPDFRANMEELDKATKRAQIEGIKEGLVDGSIKLTSVPQELIPEIRKK